jgi:hypothetical protein
MLDLQLMHNYTTATCYTISANPVLKEIWRLEVPKLAFQWDFVMRGVLAISALHLAHFREDKREYYTAYALYQHELGLREVMSLLLNVNDENCSALFVFATLHVLLALGRPRDAGDFLLFRNAGAAELVILVRGVRAIIESSHDSLLTGPLGPIMRMGRDQTKFLSEQTHEIEPLRNLRASINEHCTSSQDREAFNRALDALGKCFAASRNVGAAETAGILVWFWRLPDRYLELVKSMNPEALSIFAHFCVLLKRLEPMWWMQGWSIHLLEKIYHSLDQDLRHWIRWPIEELGWVPN